MRPHRIATLLLGGGLASGCTAAGGSYFLNRVRDLGDVVWVEVGGGLGLGGGVRAGGITQLGLGGGITFFPIGWKYGAPIVADGNMNHGMPVPTDLDLYGGPFNLRAGRLPRTESAALHRSVGLLPAVWRWETRGPDRSELWTWGAWPPDEIRRALTARVHAFDIEAHVFAGVIEVGVGFSPGQLCDFVLGWFGIDIAGDDTDWSKADATDVSPGR